MIDSVSSLVSAITTLKNNSNVGGNSGNDSMFLQLLNAIAGSIVDPTGTPGSTLQATANAASSGSDLMAVLNAGEPERTQGADGTLISVDKGKKEEGSPAAMVAILALLSAAVSRLQPWQVKSPDNSAGGSSKPPAHDSVLDVKMNGLADEILKLAPPERLAILQQALQGSVPDDKWALFQPQMPEAQAPEAQAPETQTPETQTPETQTPETPVSQAGLVGLAAKLLKSNPDHHLSGNALEAKDVVVGKGDLQVPIPTNKQGEQPAFGNDSGMNGGNSPILRQLVEPANKPQEKTLSTHDETTPVGRVSETSGLLVKTADAQQSNSSKTVHGGAEASSASLLTASIIEQIAKRAQFVASRGRSGLSIQLEPRELGKVRVYVSTGSEGLHVKLAAEASDTRQIIEASLPQLKAAFESQGLRVDSFDVMIASGFSAFNSQQDNAQRQTSTKAQSSERYFWADDSEAEGIDSVEVRRSNSIVDYRI